MNGDYLATYGQSNHLGRFVAAEPAELRRGDRVIVETPRGLEVGSILCSASANHGRLLRIAPGSLLRRATPDDEQALAVGRAQSARLFAAARALVEDHAWNLEILDTEMLLEGGTVVVQFLGSTGDADLLAELLTGQYGIAVLMESLSSVSESNDEAGCGKPNCGHGTEGGCDSCASGGCSTSGCGAGRTQVDMRDYFAHLRGRMETHQRLPLA